MVKESFEESYKKLNVAQKAAVDAVEGPVMVVAGPGTGKTQILSLRIVNIMKKTGAAPDSILAITFTEAGVHSMRKRLASIIGNDAYRVNISTFHGFCNDLIKTYPEDFPRIISSKNISDLEEVKIMEDLIDNTELNELRPYGDRYYYLDAVIKEISNLKREDISPDKLDEMTAAEEKSLKANDDLFHEKGPHKGKMKVKYADALKYIEKNKELSLLYRKYEEALREKRLYDYNDMIMEAIRALQENEDLLLRVQEYYQYILVDEHQDTNDAQNKVLELLSNYYSSPNLFIVGDEKQAIFRFQGASINNFSNFKKKYPDAKLIYLEENYRSTQSILDSAHSLIKNAIKGDAGVKLSSRNGKSSKKIRSAAFLNEENELRYVAGDIQNKIAAGETAGEIAVIYRDNHDAFPLARMLERKGIPFVIESDQNVLEDENIKKLILLLEVVNEFGDEVKFARLLHSDFVGIDELSIYKLLKYADAKKTGALELIARKSFPEGIDTLVKDKFSALYDKLSAFSKVARNKGLLEFFEELVRESGFLEYLLSGAGAVERMDRLSVVFENMKKLSLNHRDFKLSEFMEFLKMAEGRRPFKKSVAGKSGDKVHLLTAHGSKGQEYRSVYVIGLYYGHFGNRSNRSLFKLPIRGGVLEEIESNDDERRLFYVAITRAKEDVLLTHPLVNSEGRPLSPSQFLFEIDSSLLEQIDVTKDEDKFSKESILLNPSKKMDLPRGVDKEYLNELFLSHAFSVTALNNYMECPWAFFYRNLIRLPEAPARPLMYGNAIHHTLRDFFDRLKDGENIGKEKMLAFFAKYVEQEPFRGPDISDVLEKGKSALSGYYDKYINEWNRNTVNEFNIRGIIFDEKITLTGNIDKIEMLDNGGGVNVVDYKTGKTMSRNEIEGKTKTADGNYKRQLAFYKLLLDSYEGGKYKMRSAELDFIEPTDSGNYKKEKFEISDKDVNALKEDIRRVSGEILDLSFWDKRCDDKKCEYCKLREMMKRGECVKI